MPDFHRSLDAALARQQQEGPMPFDRNGDPVYAEDVLDREELAEFYAQRRALDVPRPRRSDPASAAAYSWDPTAADREAGREV